MLSVAAGNGLGELRERPSANASVSASVRGSVTVIASDGYRRSLTSRMRMGTAKECEVYVGWVVIGGPSPSWAVALGSNPGPFSRRDCEDPCLGSCGAQIG